MLTFHIWNLYSFGQSHSLLFLISYFSGFFSPLRLHTSASTLLLVSCFAYQKASSEKQNQEKINMKIYFKELGHMIWGTDKSEI